MMPLLTLANLILSLPLAAAEGTAVGLGIGLIIVLLIVGLVGLVLLIWSIIDIVNNPALSPVMKVVLILLFIFVLEIIGPIIYLLFFRSSKMAGQPGVERRV